MKIGILGGSFNPIHFGHLYIAQEVKKRLGLAQVWFIPAKQSPFKQDCQTVSFRHRLQMVRDAVQDMPGCFASNFEGLQGGISYTVDTLRWLCKLHPQDRFWFIIGSDVYVSFFQWKEPEEILKLVHLVVVTRPGFEDLNKKDDNLFSKWGHRIQWLDLEGNLASSTLLRECIRVGKGYGEFLHPSTEQYIREQGLYQK